MIAVITPETTRPDEHHTVRLLFEHGLERLHVRKYGLDDQAMRAYLAGIPVAYRPHLVLHSHYHLATVFAVRRLHINERDRAQHRYLPYRGRYSLSTSVHAIEDFNMLDDYWDYAFLSPVFASLSKPSYGGTDSLLPHLQRRTQMQVRLIGLGGVDDTNFHLLKQVGADGGALLGGIWLRNDPLQAWKACHEQDNSSIKHQPHP